MLARVSADHHVLSPDAIVVRPGDIVRVGDRGTEWPAFVFVSTEGGDGWIPERHVDEKRPDATVIHPYDTRELPVTAGDVVEVLEEDPMSGWTRCRADDSREGWVPQRVLVVEN